MKTHRDKIISKLEELRTMAACGDSTKEDSKTFTDEILSLTSQPTTEERTKSFKVKAKVRSVDKATFQTYIDKSTTEESKTMQGEEFNFGLTTVEPNKDLRNLMADTFALFNSKGFDFKSNAGVWSYIHTVVDAFSKPTTEESKEHQKNLLNELTSKDEADGLYGEVRNEIEPNVGMGADELEKDLNELIDACENYCSMTADGTKIKRYYKNREAGRHFHFLRQEFIKQYAAQLHSKCNHAERAQSKVDYRKVKCTCSKCGGYDFEQLYKDDNEEIME